MKIPCKDCTLRHENCHSNCDSWKEYEKSKPVKKLDEYEFYAITRTNKRIQKVMKRKLKQW